MFCENASQLSSKTRTLICAQSRPGPTKPRSVQLDLGRDISSVLHQVFAASASEMQGTDPLLLLVGGLGFPWLVGSAFDVSKVSLYFPGAMVVWAQHHHFHLMLYMITEPLWS